MIRRNPSPHAMNAKYKYLKPHRGYKPGHFRVWPKPYGDDLAKKGIVERVNDDGNPTDPPTVDHPQPIESPEGRRDAANPIEKRDA